MLITYSLEASKLPYQLSMNALKNNMLEFANNVILFKSIS